jgi:hypothetical protein
LGIGISDSEKFETFADNPQTQFQPLTDPLVPAVIEIVDVTLRSYFMPACSAPNLTNPEEVQEANRLLKFSKAPSPNRITNRALKQLLQRSVSLLAQILNAVLLTHQFLTACKEACVISIIKPENIRYYPHLIDPLVT